MALNYRIVIGTDHRGYDIKEFIKKQNVIGSDIVEWIDVGTDSAARTDYPPFAIKASKIILAKEAQYGILLCGTGVGMSIVANRFPGIYAGLVWTEDLARLAKEDDKVNVLVLPADYITREQALRIVQSWLTATFHAGRYQQRITMIDAIKP